MATQSFSYGEFFSGPGGMSLGATQAFEDLLDHRWAFDIDHDAVQTYNLNFADSHEIAKVADVRSIDIPRLEPVDIFAFGFPCNDFSVVGEQLGISGNYGPLYSFGIKVLTELKPKAFVAENVSGLTSANEGEALKMILREMTEAGYRVTPHLYSAENYGVPQRRKRIIIVGIRADLGYTYLVPIPTTVKPPTVRDALIDIPVPIDATNNEFTKQSKLVVERLQHIKPGENAFTAALPENLQLNVVGAKISQIYRRLHPDQPAYTITGSGGGGTHVYHWEENRALTNRERARLQSFPDSFSFVGSKESVRKQIGMAVPPELARVVFESLGKTLSGIEYSSIPHNISYDGQRVKKARQPSLIYESASNYA